MLDDNFKTERVEATAAKSEDCQDSMQIAWRYQNAPKVEVSLWYFITVPLAEQALSNMTVLQDYLLKVNHPATMYVLITRDTERKGI